MSITILVQPIPTGFSATTGGRLTCRRGSIGGQGARSSGKDRSRLDGGAILIDQPIQPARSPSPVLPLTENPLFEPWLEAVETYRANQENPETPGVSEAP